MLRFACPIYASGQPQENYTLCPKHECEGQHKAERDATIQAVTPRYIKPFSECIYRHQKSPSSCPEPKPVMRRAGCQDWLCMVRRSRFTIVSTPRHTDIHVVSPDV